MLKNCVFEIKKSVRKASRDKVFGNKSHGILKQFYTKEFWNQQIPVYVILRGHYFKSEKFLDSFLLKHQSNSVPLIEIIRFGLKEKMHQDVIDFLILVAVMFPSTKLKKQERSFEEGLEYIRF